MSMAARLPLFLCLGSSAATTTIRIGVGGDKHTKNYIYILLHLFGIFRGKKIDLSNLDVRHFKPVPFNFPTFWQAVLRNVYR